VNIQVGYGANNSSLQNISLLQNVTKGLRRGRILVGKLEGKRPLEDQGIDGWMLKWILER
jgi:hypothetical protein